MSGQRGVLQSGLLAELELRKHWAVDGALARIDEAFGPSTRSKDDRCIRSHSASPARRNPAQARSCRSRSCRERPSGPRSPSQGARRAQSWAARGAPARQALSIDRPPVRADATPSSRRRSKAFRRRRKSEIAEAEALLAALSQTDEVKAQAAQRQRLTQLQVAYGNALIAARGYGAPETTEAFARARESASGDKDAPERLAADLRPMGRQLRARRVAVDAGARGGLPQRRRGETRFAQGRRRASRPGLTYWFAGEYREARGSFGAGARPVPIRP